MTPLLGGDLGIPPEATPALQRVLGSRAFARAHKLRDFLRFVVEESLAGRADGLKEYTIGVEVFGRGAQFDPRVDPVVRVHAGKLRDRLDRYYREEGAEDSIRIRIPRGQYVPEFLPAQTAHSARNGPIVLPKRSELASPSLAVLPFLNLSGDPEYEYFSDGLSEELISLAGRIPGLRVLARTSSFSFKGKGTGIEEISRALRANLILEGSVQRRGESIRVTARLNEAPSGHQIWSRKYDGRLEDLFALQDEIAGQIAETLRSTEGIHQSARTTNVESHLLLLQAWHHLFRNRMDSLAKAREYFEKALQADPGNAKANAGLSIVWTGTTVFHAASWAEAYPLAAATAQRAVELAPDDAESWVAVGVVRSMLEWKWAEAEEAFRRAIQLNPNYAVAHHLGSVGYLMPMGRGDEAVREMEIAVDLDPLSPMVRCDVGTMSTYAGRYEEALRGYEAALDLEPRNTRSIFEHAWTLLHMGRVEDGLRRMEAHLEFLEDFPVLCGMYALGLALAGRRHEALAQLGLMRAASSDGHLRTNPPVFTLDALGLREEALDEFECALERHDPHLRYMNVNPRAHLIRHEPRFQAVLDKVGLSLPGPDPHVALQKRNRLP